jgi:hypothetical protein
MNITMTVPNKAINVRIVLEKVVRLLADQPCDETVRMLLLQASSKGSSPYNITNGIQLDYENPLLHSRMMLALFTLIRPVIPIILTRPVAFKIPANPLRHSKITGESELGVYIKVSLANKRFKRNNPSRICKKKEFY